jgi:hypothetical protein
MLDQRGVFIDAYILDKWVDHSDGRSIFCIRYKYLQNMDAVQTVNRIVFDRLIKGGNIKILVLEQLPYVSRLHPEMQ